MYIHPTAASVDFRKTWIIARFVTTEGTGSAVSVTDDWDVLVIVSVVVDTSVVVTASAVSATMTVDWYVSVTVSVVVDASVAVTTSAVLVLVTTGVDMERRRHLQPYDTRPVL